MKIALLLCVVPALVWAANDDVIPLNRRTQAPKSDTNNDASTVLGKSGGITPKPTEKEKQMAAEDAMPKPYLAGIDTFGSTRVNETKLKQLLGKELDMWVAKGLAGDPSAPKLEAKLLAKIKAKFEFPVADWSVMQYYEPGDLAVFLTLDVVEKADLAERMPFMPPPTSEVRDPDNLIKTWMEYEDVAMELVESGALDPETTECPALHCPFGHKHVRLKKYEKTFLEGVAKNEKVLVDVLNSDKRDDHRAASAFLLAYLKDGKKVVQYMVDRIKDPAPHVRNNVLRVLGDIAEFHPEFPIPIKPVVEALKFPRVSDRTKSLYVVHLMSLNSQQARDEVLKTAIPSLLSMLNAKVPDSRDLSHATLRKVSGKDFAASDVPSWTAWYQKASKDRAISNKKP